MIIKKLTIKNFRSYFREQSFEFSDHLNLILGANGDGKTTIFDALKWVFATDGKDSDLKSSSLVSSKFFSSLPPAGIGEVRVSVVVKHKNHDYTIERSFLVSKENDGRMKISDPKHIGYMSIPGVARRTAPAQDLIERQGLFPAIIKKYCLFKGESELNIFKDQKTLINLINLFSEVKDFEPFKVFSSYAEGLTNQARINAINKNKANAEKAENTKKEIDRVQNLLKGLNERIKDWTNSYEDYERKLRDLDNSKNTIELVNGLQNTISAKINEKNNEIENLDENYSIKLLDDYWILYGYLPILEEYAEKTKEISKERERLSLEQLKQIAQKEAKKEAIKELEKEISQLPWFIPDIKTMEEMISEHKCKVCGTDAPEGSAPYNFMYRRLQEAIKHKKEAASLKKEENTQEPALFVHDYINQLRQHSISLYGFDTEIEHIGTQIAEKIEENDKIHDKINKLTSEISKLEKKIDEIIAQSASGVDVDSYLSLFSKLQNWSKGQIETQEKISDAEKKKPELEEKLKKLNKEYNKFITKEGLIYATMYNFFSRLSVSLDRAESSSFDNFLESLKDEANKFISLLNVDDFSGIVDIYNNGNGKVYLQLTDKNGKIVEHPNTSLETTMHISILLAISELTKKERENEYPLIFDAPTSTFDEGKDADFYACLNSRVDKQCIVVTKSFLNRTNDNEYVVDNIRLEKFDCPVYRIKKIEGFDQKDLSTIQTIVEPVKNIK